MVIIPAATRSRIGNTKQSIWRFCQAESNGTTKKQIEKNNFYAEFDFIELRKNYKPPLCCSCNTITNPGKLLHLPEVGVRAGLGSAEGIATATCGLREGRYDVIRAAVCWKLNVEMTLEKYIHYVYPYPLCIPMYFQ